MNGRAICTGENVLEEVDEEASLCPACLEAIQWVEYLRWELRHQPVPA